MKIRTFAEARGEIQRPIALTQNLRERDLLSEKLKQMGSAAASRVHLETGKSRNIHEPHARRDPSAKPC